MIVDECLLYLTATQNLDIEQKTIDSELLKFNGWLIYLNTVGEVNHIYFNT